MRIKLPACALNTVPILMPSVQGPIVWAVFGVIHAGERPCMRSETCACPRAFCFQGPIVEPTFHPSDEQLRDLTDMFKMYDADKSGVVNKHQCISVD